MGYVGGFSGLRSRRHREGSKAQQWKFKWTMKWKWNDNDKLAYVRDYGVKELEYCPK